MKRGNREGLQTWALLAEVVSAIVVVVTLGFLILETRENTNAIQAQTFQDLMRDVNNWRESIRESERRGTLEKWRKERAEGLTETEFGLVRLIYLQLWGIYEAAYFANERDVLGVDEWARFERSICFERRNSDAFWRDAYQGLPPFETILTPSFAAYVERACPSN